MLVTLGKRLYDHCKGLLRHRALGVIRVTQGRHPDMAGCLAVALGRDTAHSLFRYSETQEFLSPFRYTR